MKRRIFQGRRGASAMEFGLTLPVLLLFMGGICEYGLLFNEYLGVISSARNGARWGANWNVDTGETVDEAILRVRESLPLVGLSCTEDEENAGDCFVTAELVDIGGYDAVELQVGVDYDPIMGGLIPVPPQLSHESVMVLAQQL